jgi:hypothetical protein
MSHSTDIPDRVKHSDNWLDWISANEKRWQKRLAREATERASTEWICEYIAAQALTMQHAPLEARTAACAEILATLRDAGLWPPAEIPDEPTA